MSPLNPLRLLGSYIGAVVYPAAVFLAGGFTDSPPFGIPVSKFLIQANHILVAPINFVLSKAGLLGDPNALAYGFALVTVLGLLGGWGIHSVIRLKRRRKS
jgi:hypothetical protein